MRFLLALLVLAAGCAPEPPPPEMFFCEYCKKPRVDARPYACRKCGKAHNSCPVEKPIHAMDFNKDKEGVTLGRSVKVCP